MTNTKIRLLVFFSLSVLLFQNCYREEVFFDSYHGEVLNFTMPIDQEELLYKSRGSQIFIDSPTPVLYISDQQIDVDRFKTRGQNTLNFKKKSFSVNLDKIVEWHYDDKLYFAEKFKLLSMVYDFTYIENKVALKLFEKVGLWDLPTFFTEVQINGNHNGLYLFVPDPETFLLNENNADFVLRRDYWDGIRRFERNENSEYSDDFYIEKYYSIYTLIQNLSGQELYDELNKILDLENYFKLLAVNYLIRNGDYTDEMFFYTTYKNGNLVFSPIPWDCDDVFEEHPHEIGRGWGFGPIFNNRTYNTREDVINDVGDILLFSVEEDLDYKIAKDTVLYAAYLKQTKNVINILTKNTIEKVFSEVYNELLPYYTTLDLYELSTYDERRTNYSIWEENMNAKRGIVLHQLELMQNTLNK